MFELPTPEVSPDEARAVADDVLSGRAYLEAARPDPLPQRIIDWIGDRFVELFGALSSGGGRGVTAWIVIGAFGLLIAFLLSRLAGNFSAVPALEADPDPRVDISDELSAEAWLRRAIEAEASGDWRLAIRDRHRALVATMVERRLLVDRAGQTSGEIAATVGADYPTVAADLDAATGLFKDVWYGWIEPGPADRDRFVALADAVLERLPRESERRNGSLMSASR